MMKNLLSNQDLVMVPPASHDEGGFGFINL